MAQAHLPWAGVRPPARPCGRFPGLCRAVRLVAADHDRVARPLAAAATHLVVQAVRLAAADHAPESRQAVRLAGPRITHLRSPAGLSAWRPRTTNLRHAGLSAWRLRTTNCLCRAVRLAAADHEPAWSLRQPNLQPPQRWDRLGRHAVP